MTKRKPYRPPYNGGYLPPSLAPVLAPCAGSNRAAAHEWARDPDGVYRCYRCNEPYIQKTRSR